MGGEKQEIDSFRRSQYRTVYKDRSSKSLGEGEQSSRMKLVQHSSLKKLQTKLGQIDARKPLKVQADKSREEPVVKAALEKLNFKHHNPEQCLCDHCQCGRHLCKFKLVKPDFVQKSSYRSQFPAKNVINSETVIAQETKPLNAGSLVLKSVYNQSFKQGEGDKLQRPHPENLIKEGGPSTDTTTYGMNYRNFQVPNQYIKHTDRHSIQYFPFRSKSIYTKQFISKPIRRHQSLKAIDQIHKGKLWLGQSTYNQSFQQHEKSVLTPIRSRIQPAKQTINDPNRFNTTYKREFINKKFTVCPAKQEIVTFKLSSLKNSLIQSANFREISPNFQAISTSKYYYV